MMDTTTLLTELDNNTNALSEMLLDIHPSVFDRQPFPGSWSAAEVGEHIYVLDKFIFSLLTGENESAKRPADEKIPLIRSVFTNRSRTLSAPEPIVPLGKMKDQQLLIAKIITVRKDVYRFIPAADLSLICTGFTHGSFGAMTRLEWISFMIMHAQRHLHQLKNISEINADH